MAHKRTVSRKKKLALLVGAFALAGTGAGVMAATSNASTGMASGAGGAEAKGEVVCPGSTVTLSGEGGAPGATSGEFPVGTKLKVTNLDNDKSTTVSVTGPSGSCALLNNAAFEQVREPGKNLIRNARIERVGEGGGDAGQSAEQPPADGADDGGAADDAGAEAGAGAGAGGAEAKGEVVCPGSTVTLSGEGGAPGATSGDFPVGTKLKVTNLDNDKSTTVSVTGPSGSCALLNNAAFEEVREPGKNLIRNARIERVG
ncbi:hypothetical protein ACFYYR_21455 [Streptomyces sp. NPDC001922]|uniref:hypothetical protein n=1 Tax=Streptomyces sp. NPDC001922 TaxID=3364624 RepID=UPI00369A2266